MTLSLWASEEGDVAAGAGRSPAWWVRKSGVASAAAYQVRAGLAQSTIGGGLGVLVHDLAVGALTLR